MWPSRLLVIRSRSWTWWRFSSPMSIPINTLVSARSIHSSSASTTTTSRTGTKVFSSSMETGLTMRWLNCCCGAFVPIPKSSFIALTIVDLRLGNFCARHLARVGKKRLMPFLVASPCLKKKLAPRNAVFGGKHSCVKGCLSFRALATVSAILVLPVPAIPYSHKIGSLVGLSAQCWISLRIRHCVPGKQGASTPRTSAESNVAFPAKGNDSRRSVSLPALNGKIG